MAQAKKKAVAKTAKREVSAEVAQFEQFAGTGFEETTTEDLAIPFLRILDSSSPQCSKRNGAYVDGAEGGMIFNTVLNEVYDGEKGMLFVPAHYNRRFVEWVPRDEGGGYVASYHRNDPIVGTVERDEKGQDVLPNGNTLSNTAQYFGFLLHPDHGPLQALITMNSTQLKKSKKWNSQMQSFTAKGANGQFTLPMMSQVYHLTTVPESNDKGEWFGWEITRDRQLDLSNQDDADLFKKALAFCEAVKEGSVEIKPEEQHNTSASKPGSKASPSKPAEFQDDEIPF